MKVLYLTGIPSPYRVDLFNEIGKSIDLTVVFLAEYQGDRNKDWQSSKPETFQTIVLNAGALQGSKIDFSMVRYLQKHAKNFDAIVIHGYSFPAALFAIAWLNLHHIPYGIEADGAIIPNSERAMKRKLKQFSFQNAAFCLSSGAATTDFFIHYGAAPKRCYTYPFTSISKRDLAAAKAFSPEEKAALREALSIAETQVLLVVGPHKQEKENIIRQLTEPKQSVRLIFADELAEEQVYSYLACADAVVDWTADNPLADAALWFGVPVLKETEEISRLLCEPEQLRIIGQRTLMEKMTPNAVEDKFFAATLAAAKLHRQVCRKLLGIEQDKTVVLYVGQLIHRKGIDVLLKAVAELGEDYQLLIIGGKPPKEYTALAENLKLNNVQFFDFMGKEELEKYYKSADVFALATREDIWGLVVNEALQYGLPTVSTKRCLAALKLLPRDCVIPIEDVCQLQNAIERQSRMTAEDTENWQRYSWKISVENTVEESARTHIDIFNSIIRNR